MATNYSSTETTLRALLSDLVNMDAQAIAGYFDVCKGLMSRVKTARERMLWHVALAAGELAEMGERPDVPNLMGGWIDVEREERAEAALRPA